MMGRKAVIDIGTNSIKFCVAERAADGAVTTVLDQNNIARLGEGLRETGALSSEAMARNAQAIADFTALAHGHGTDEIIAVGTMALRTATNSQDFLNLVRRETGIDIRIIPGDEEARLSYLAVVSSLPLACRDVAIVDTGGGSTELVFGHGNEISRKFSINLGAVAITEQFFRMDPVPGAQVEAAMVEIQRILDANGVTEPVEQLVGMGGAITSMGSVKHQMAVYDPDTIQGSKLESFEIDRQISLYSSLALDARKQIIGLQPKRADVILAGACIVKAMITRLGVNYLTISDRGLRHGIMHEAFTR